jgi:hypothetical protein
MMSNITCEVVFAPLLRQFSNRGLAYLNRRPVGSLDVDAWKACVIATEQYAAPTWAFELVNDIKETFGVEE